MVKRRVNNAPMQATAKHKQDSPKISVFDRWGHVFKQELRQVDELIIKLAESDAALIPKIVTHIISSGGKRLRPILTILCAKLCGYSGGMRHVNLAATVEFLHTATLLHDDVVDESDLRRGEATANNLWGNSASVLVGDFLLSRAFQLMAGDGSIKVLKILSDTSAIITEGEVKQLMAANEIATDEKTYIDIISAKTAALFAASCQIGAVLVDEKDEKRENSLREFGKNLGIAFQIIDDALDYSAKQEELGKTVGDDLREGKMTLPVIISYARGNNEERKFWERVISGEQGESDLRYAIALIKKQGVLTEVVMQAKEYAEKAKAALAEFADSDEKSALLELADFAVDRPY